MAKTHEYAVRDGDTGFVDAHYTELIRECDVFCGQIRQGLQERQEST